MVTGKSAGENGSICLQVVELRRLSETNYISDASIFEPRSSMEKSDSTGNSVSPTNTPVRATEKKLTLFALRLAVFEIAATGLRTLGFIWATVVLLGSFAISLDTTDFWFITLEWQHQATWSIADAGMNRKRDCQLKTTPTWTSSDVPILPYAQCFFLSRNVSKLLYWLQLACATACLALSLIKLIKRHYVEISKGDTDERNRQSALTIFYALTLAKALFFLMEKAYWEWKSVNWPSGMISIKKLFYDSYSRCINGSIFDGLKMDLVTFAMYLLASNSPDEQLIGVQILRQFAMNWDKCISYREISEIVFTNSNIRDILRHGEKQPMLQKLGIEILTNPALEELFNIFFRYGAPESPNRIRNAAGEALAMLALESRSNCHRILKLMVLERLVEALEVPFVLMAIMLEENKLQAVMVELAAEVFKFMSSQESSMMFKRAGVKEAELPSTIVQILKKHENPSTKVPRIRRFAIGLAIWMMRENAQNVHIFKDLRLEKELEHISETTVELENFNIFSGTVGLSRQSTTIHSLVGTAMKLLEERQNHATEQ
ncbi:hypothetical protein P3X46_006063 [Hevea brasiliensis]|uniref:Uncharacterized protein n=1 Tax=Hevea brasiliensis TaxID=3981 RepID=A0ABQ9MQ15_HEVBR|nr:hypothetical protein P3X46_006063 [Hevea brasiliensis]